jgi:hypothetical protein
VLDVSLVVVQETSDIRTHLFLLLVRFLPRDQRHINVSMQMEFRQKKESERVPSRGRQRICCTRRSRRCGYLQCLRESAKAIEISSASSCSCMCVCVCVSGAVQSLVPWVDQGSRHNQQNWCWLQVLRNRKSTRRWSTSIRARVPHVAGPADISTAADRARETLT